MNTLDEKYAIIGAEGFAGRHLYNALVSMGKDVIAVCHRTPDYPCEFRYADITDITSLRKVLQGITHIFHLAAMTEVGRVREMELEVFRVNVFGTECVIKAAQEAGVQRLLYTSTCHIYGNAPSPITEETPPGPVDIYSKTKWLGEFVCRNLQDNMEIVITRAFNHYGQHQKQSFLIPSSIRKLRQKTTTFYSPTASRDFTHVKDIVHGYWLAMSKGKNEQVYQFCSSTERTVKSVVEDIKRLMNSDCEVAWQGERENDFRQYGSYAKVKRELGWKPITGWEEGLQETIKHYDTEQTQTKET